MSYIKELNFIIYYFKKLRISKNTEKKILINLFFHNFLICFIPNLTKINQFLFELSYF